jgi:hypothetical protein
MERSHVEEREQETREDSGLLLPWIAIVECAMTIIAFFAIGILPGMVVFFIAIMFVSSAIATCAAIGCVIELVFLFDILTNYKKAKTEQKKV